MVGYEGKAKRYSEAQEALFAPVSSYLMPSGAQVAADLAPGYAGEVCAREIFAVQSIRPIYILKRVWNM
jgi:hypothetical protein